MRSILIAAAAAIVVPGAAQAQFVTGIKLEPAEIQAGQETKITVDFDKKQINCGLRLHFGDGAQTDYKINQAKDVPLVATHRYASAGEFRVMAEPKTVGFVAPCGRRNTEAMLKVAAAPAAPAAPAKPAPAAKSKAKAASPECPAGWSLDKTSVRKNGAYTCKAQAGAKLPEQRRGCPGELSYFENEKKGMLGCRP